MRESCEPMGPQQITSQMLFLTYDAVILRAKVARFLLQHSLISNMMCVSIGLFHFVPVQSHGQPRVPYVQLRMEYVTLGSA